MTGTATIGRNAKVYVGASIVTLVHNVTAGAAAVVDKEYTMDSPLPALLTSGNQSFTWSAEMLYIDNSLLTKLLAGTTFTLSFFKTTSPDATPYEVWTGCIVTKWDKKAAMTGALLVTVSGEAKGVTVT